MAAVTQDGTALEYASWAASASKPAGAHLL
jgi:hypothetical protein